MIMMNAFCTSLGLDFQKAVCKYRVFFFAVKEFLMFLFDIFFGIFRCCPIFTYHLVIYYTSHIMRVKLSENYSKLPTLKGTKKANLLCSIKMLPTKGWQPYSPKKLRKLFQSGVVSIPKVIKTI